MDSSVHGVVVVSGSGTIQFVTTGARQALTTYFGGRFGAGDSLPSVLKHRIVRLKRTVRKRQKRAPEPLVIHRQNRRLVLRLLLEDTCSVLLIEEGPTGVPIDALGLTRRETEVAAYLPLGKTNAQIATTLGIRARTVGKHLEGIYRKLGVETRMAAVARIVETNSEVVRRAGGTRT